MNPMKIFFPKGKKIKTLSIKDLKKAKACKQEQARWLALFGKKPVPVMLLAGFVRDINTLLKWAENHGLLSIPWANQQATSEEHNYIYKFQSKKGRITKADYTEMLFYVLRQHNRTLIRRQLDATIQRMSYGAT